MLILCLLHHLIESYKYKNNFKYFAMKVKSGILLKVKFSLTIFLLISFLPVNAAITVGSVLGDNMVLQRNSEVKLWGKAGANQKLNIVVGWSNEKISTTANDKGEWLVKVKTTEAGGPYTISIMSQKEKLMFKNILLGEVWLCSGQSNMQMPVSGFTYNPVNGSTDALLWANNPSLRLFKVKMSASSQPRDSCGGEWLEATAESAAQFSAVGYFFGKLLQERLKVPVGMICSSWGGSRIEAWMKHETISEFPSAYEQTTREKQSPNQRASNLYNGMIAPLLNYSIKGVLWYQGESNIINNQDYAALQSAMVKSWRTDFGLGDFPFYFVEIAPFRYGNSKAVNSALLREQQYRSKALIPNSDMVSTVDLGNENSIHPAEKITVAKRLLLCALSDTYGIKGLPHSSPVYKNFSVKDSMAILTFTAQGLTSFDKKVDCFELAGQDSVFHPAETRIQQNKVILISTGVKHPIAIRYAFHNFCPTDGYIYDMAGLPLLLFRTDDWNK